MSLAGQTASASVADIIDMILNQVKVPEERRLVSVMDKLIEANDANRGHVSNVISHLNETFWHTAATIGSSSKKVPANLVLHLWDQMQAFTSERDKLKSDMAQIKDLLRNMIGNSKVPQEIRDRLPECLVQYAPGWVASLPRVNELQHELRYDRALWKRYTMLAQKIEMYAAMPLLY